MKTSLLSVLSLPLLALTQSTDFSPPFNPDPDFTSNIPENPITSNTFSPSITIPASEDFTISITYFEPTQTDFTISDNDPILTGTPDPRPNLTASTTVNTSSGAGTTSSGSLTTSRSTIVSGSGTAVTTSVSTTSLAAGAGSVGKGVESAFAGLMIGILGALAWL